LFATALVLHAALGTVVLTRLLKAVQPSLLMILGPGLILGGAISFVVFQAIGRGTMGAIAAVSAGVLAAVQLCRVTTINNYQPMSREFLIHVFGLAALAMSSEFNWLILVALGSLASVTLLNIRATQVDRALSLPVLVYIFAAGGATFFRGKWWWLITDDYQFFEVLARHLSESGPLEKWGVLDVSNYHWLSFGWSGLLDYISQSPGPLVTLTRVMPPAYSLALASSLLMLTQHAGTLARPKLLTVLPAWVVLANFRLDWAAPSTAGVYAVLAALIALLKLSLDLKVRFWRRAIMYGSFSIIAIVTKFPSILSVLPVIAAAEYLQIQRARVHSRVVIGAGITVGISCAVAFATLPWLSAILGDFSVEARRMSGALWFYGPAAFIAKSTLDNLWIAIFILVGVVATLRHGRAMGLTAGDAFLLSLSPFFVSGIVLRSIVNGAANINEYFSGPSLFLSTLTLLTITRLAQQNMSSVLSPFIWLSGISSAVLLVLWTILAKKIDLPYELSRGSVLNTLTDWRVLSGFVLCVLLTKRWRAKTIDPRLSTSVFLVLSLLYGVAPTTREVLSKGVRPAAPTYELDSLLGSKDRQEVGRWISRNTEKASKLATNSLFRDQQRNDYSDDFSLAVWSQREFLVLGPKFFGISRSAPLEIEVSMRFADNPGLSDAKFLRAQGVSWFVVDTGLTGRRGWEPFGRIAYSAGRFVVLMLLSPDS
jgi:hypothetical protein